MTKIAVLSGIHEKLPLAELKSVLEADSNAYELIENFGTAVKFSSDTKEFCRLAYTKEVSEVLKTFSKIEDLDTGDISFEGSFAVRTSSAIDDIKNKEKIESDVGKELGRKGNEVDLSEPDNIFRVFKNGEELILSKKIFDNDGGSFENRRSHLRPFSSPVSLHPKLARCLVNLSEATKGGRILDPFCGTGGILLEAGLAGFKPVGIDKDPKMIEGAIENLEHYGVDSYKFFEGDASEKILEIGKVDSIVTDLPYGRASKKDFESDKIVEKLINEGKKVCEGKIVFMTNQNRICGFKPDFEYYVHGSLTRYIYVLNPQNL